MSDNIFINPPRRGQPANLSQQSSFLGDAAGFITGVTDVIKNTGDAIGAGLGSYFDIQRRLETAENAGIDSSFIDAQNPGIALPGGANITQNQVLIGLGVALGLGGLFLAVRG